MLNLLIFAKMREYLSQGARRGNRYSLCAQVKERTSPLGMILDTDAVSGYVFGLQVLLGAVWKSCESDHNPEPRLSMPAVSIGKAEQYVLS